MWRRFVVALVLGAVAYLRAPNPEHRTPFADAANVPHPHGGTPGKRHVLVVVNQALSGDELRQRLTDMGERLELDVLAPVLTSHLHYAVSDIDSELAEARKRLDRSLAWARHSGFVARGEVGDANPTTAIEDELRDFGADAVVVVTHPRELQTWQEQGELERLRRELAGSLWNMSWSAVAAATTSSTRCSGPLPLSPSLPKTSSAGTRRQSRARPGPSTLTDTRM